MLVLLSFIYYVHSDKDTGLHQDYGRPLLDNEASSLFLTKVLGMADCHRTGDAAVEVAQAETLMSTIQGEGSLNSTKSRHPNYKSSRERSSLREKIFQELIDEPRLDNDEEICLGVGGAKPKDVRNEKVAIIIIGLPASGKSSVSEALSDIYGAYIVDSDYAKRKFPEFGSSHGASIVHEESSLVTFGGIEDVSIPCLLGFCTISSANIIVPKIGHSVKSVRSLRDDLMRKGYDVHLVCVSLDRKEACKRALERFIDTGRYVPLGLIFDGYSNEPTLTYYRVRDDKEWASVGKLCTESMRENEGRSKVLYSSGTNSPVERLKKMDKAL